MPTPIPFSDISFDDNENCCVSGAGAKTLRDALIQKQPNTMAELADKYSYVDPKDISIDDSGQIVISNTKFSGLVKTALGVDPTVAFLDTNCSCNPK